MLPADNNSAKMEGSNPELQEKLQELEHELEVGCTVFNGECCDLAPSRAYCALARGSINS